MQGYEKGTPQGVPFLQVRLAAHVSNGLEF